ncbi:MAG: PilZ domain-containing protein [Phycisphaerales bacterium]|nr:PilZ domain-containing protein [Phycisphaerales bacterium]
MPRQHDGENLSSTDKALLDATLGMLSQGDLSGGESQRKQPRYSPVNTEATVILDQLGGSRISCQTGVYNISTGGALIIIKAYAHKDTPISLCLRTIDSEEVMITGRIAWCSYWDKGFHRAGVEFKSPIDLRHFVDPKVRIEQTSNDAQTLWAERRSALHIDSDPLEIDTVAMLIQNANFSCEHTEVVGSALDMVQQNLYDLVIISDNIADINTVDSIAQLRDNGYGGPIIVLCSASSTQDLTRGAKGEVTVLHKPIQLATLLVMLRDLFDRDMDIVNGTGKIYTSLRPEQCSNDRLEVYIGLISRCARQLDQALKADDYDTSLRICNSLHSSGTGFGYPILSTTASEVIQALNASCSAQESAVSIRSLIRLISRIRSRENASGDAKTTGKRVA